MTSGRYRAQAVKLRRSIPLQLLDLVECALCLAQAGQGHTAILKDLLAADDRRAAEDVRTYLSAGEATTARCPSVA
ncbi:MAG: hypothetical protein H7147_08395 [Frankiaceae bacterium]|nr:hypothetical protein [Arenimonas sp.]